MIFNKIYLNFHGILTKPLRTNKREVGVYCLSTIILRSCCSAVRIEQTADETEKEKPQTRVFWSCHCRVSYALCGAWTFIHTWYILESSNPLSLLILRYTFLDILIIYSLKKPNAGIKSDAPLNQMATLHVNQVAKAARLKDTFTSTSTLHLFQEFYLFHDSFFWKRILLKLWTKFKHYKQREKVSIITLNFRYIWFPKKYPLKKKKILIIFSYLILL